MRKIACDSWCFALALAAALALVGCGKKNGAETGSTAGGGAGLAASAGPVRSDFTDGAKKLFGGVPAEAFAVAFVDSSTELWSYLLHGGLVLELDAGSREALDAELRAFLTSRIGLDVTKVQSAVAFGVGGKPGAVLVGGVGGELEARSAGKYRDATLVVLAAQEGLFAAKRGDVLVVGTQEGVRAAIDSLAGEHPSLVKKHPDLWKWIQKECGGAFLGVASGMLGAAAPEVQAFAENLGLERGCLRLDQRGMRGVLEGDEAKLGRMAGMVKARLEQQLGMVEQAKRAVIAADGPTIQVAASIVGYHYMKSLVAQLEPKQKGGRMEFELPLQLGNPGFIVALLGVSSAVAIPAFLKYIKKSKTSEARQFVRKLYDGARAYYMDAGIARGSMTPVPPQFPEPSVGPTPPLGNCCKAGGKCAPDASLWMADTWVALMFSVDDPHFYSYEYEVIDKEKEFAVRAFGDLDCDGVYSTFEMRGTADPAQGGPSGSAHLGVERELE